MSSALRAASSPNGSPKPKAGEPSALQVGGLFMYVWRGWGGGGKFMRHFLLVCCYHISTLPHPIPLHPTLPYYL